jgi:hypothetical protein
MRVAPRRRAMVMAETQRSPESVRSARALARPHGSARTPPPAFPFLQTTCQRALGRGDRKRTVWLLPPRRGEYETHHPVTPGKPRFQSGDCLPTAAYQYMAREQP